MERNYAVAPGEFLQEWIEENNNITQEELAKRLGVSRKHINEVLSGKASISSDFAIKLERVTGIPANAWLRYEALYREDIARLKEQNGLAYYANKISPQVSRFLREHGVTKATLKSPGQLVGDFLTLVQCGTFEAFEVKYAETVYSTLKESKRDLDPVAFMAWLCLGEQSKSYADGCSFEYNKDCLMGMIPDLKARAANPDSFMASDMANMLKNAGVVLQFLDAPSGLPLYGVTSWIDSNVPVMQLTGRRCKDGNIIWSIFHELGHIVNDDSRVLNLEYSNNSSISQSEKNANAFANDVLFGVSGLSPFYGMHSSESILNRAKEMNIAPGVAVVQMRKKRMIGYSECSDLLNDIELPMCV